MKKEIIIILFVIIITKLNAQNFKKIDSLLEKGRYKIALKKLKKITPTFKSNLKIATIYESIDNTKKASEFYKKALVFKDHYATKIKLGKSLRKEKKITEAIGLFENISKKDTNNLLVKYFLGKLYLQSKKGKKAKRIFQELIEKDKKNANYHYQLGLANTLLKKKYKRIDNFLEVYNLENSHFNAIEKLARAYTKLRDKDSARIFIDKGLQLNKNHINLNKLKINDLYVQKKYTESLLLLKRLDSLVPRQHYVKKMLGKTYYHLKETENAIDNFSKATFIDREDFKSFSYLGDLYFQQKKIERAKFYYFMGTYAGREPRDNEFMGLAKVYTEMKLPKRVIEQYKLALKENKKNYVALFELAKISDDYYKDKKVGYDLYVKYMNSFKGKNKELDAFVKNRIKTIKKEYFLKGETLE